MPEDAVRLLSRVLVTVASVAAAAAVFGALTRFTKSRSRGGAPAGGARYRVMVDDNYHYMDESERYQLGEYATLEEAVEACRNVVDRFLEETYRPGMTSGELITQYSMFGEDPWVQGGAPGSVPFSARDYASRRVREICGD
jgi:hypothetical protein